jgi:hypothetical protein
VKNSAPLQELQTASNYSPAVERGSDQVALFASLGLTVPGACRRDSPARMVLESTDSIGEGVAIIELIRDPAGRVADVDYLQVNGVFEQHAGWQDPRLGRRSGMAPFPEDDWLEGVDRVVRTGEPERWEAYSRQTRRWYRCSLSRVGGEGSQLIVLIFENITGRKNRERNRALLTAVTDDLAGLENVSETMNRVGKRIARHFHLPWCVITEPGLDLDTSEIRHVWQAPGVAPLAGSYRIRDYLAGDVLASHLRGNRRSSAIPRTIRGCTPPDTTHSASAPSWPCRSCGIGFAAFGFQFATATSAPGATTRSSWCES